MIISPAGEYGWEGTTEREEEQGMCPEGVITLKTEKGPSKDTGIRKQNPDKEKHI